MKFIPHFVPLVDLGGVVYPVRILLDINDDLGMVVSMTSSHNISASKSEGRTRSYTEVVA